MPMLSKSDVSYAKLQLQYPIYAADFDPYRRGYLMVGGGGGESSTGISNQISLLDISDRRTITSVANIDLSRTEDSVSSLANLATKDGLIALAGINSSTSDQKEGMNEHFRAFDIKYPPRKKQKTAEAGIPETGDIAPLGKRALFKASPASKDQTYQRLLRLSPAKRDESGSKRVGAIATGLAKDSEVIVFNATVVPPEEADILARIELPPRSEAADLDIAQTDSSEFSVAYCDEHNIYEQTFAYDFATKKVEKRPRGPRRIHQMPFPDALLDPKSRPKYRCLRFLNELTLLALVNKANKKGAELRMYHLYPTGPAMEVATKSLPSHIKQAASMDVCALDTDKNGNQQVVVAVAGQDISIEVFTTNYSTSTDTFSSLRSYLTMSQVHDQGMTQICFEPFHSPKRAPDPDEVPTSGPNGEPIEYQSPAQLHPGPQYIRLASVSYANTVVVETFPLSPLEPKNKNSRYVLSHPSDESFWFWSYAVVIGCIALVTAFLAQSFISGTSADGSGFSLIPASVQQWLDMPADAAFGGVVLPSTGNGASSSSTSFIPVPTEALEPFTDGEPVATSSLRGLLPEDHTDAENAQATLVVIHDGPDGSGLDVNVHPDKQEYLEKNPHAKHWHELDDETKAYWKAKLIKAGRWAEHEGETVLKGILWSSYAGFVGNVGGQVLREL